MAASPTSQTRLRSLDKKLVSMERPFARATLIEKNRFVNAYVREFKKGGFINADNLVFQHQVNINKILTVASKRTVNVFGLDAANFIRAQIPKKQTENDLFIGLTSLEIANETQFGDIMFTHFWEEWVNNNVTEQSRLISTTTQNDIRRALIPDDPLVQLTVIDIAKRVAGVKGLNRTRAIVIARTETHNAATFAQQRTGEVLADDVGINLVKLWVPNTDQRTRDAHIAMLGSPPISLKNKFLVGGEAMQRPGDPAASASNVVNCRCFLTHKVIN